jgi:DNA mismatch repair ATPase MutS
METKHIFETIQKMKEKHSYCIILVRNDKDFYVSAYEDSKKVAEACKLQTEWVWDSENNIVDMTYFKANEMDKYLPKIVKAGYKVAIVDPIY